MSEKPTHQISPLPQKKALRKIFQRPILGTLPRSETPTRRTLASGRSQAKTLALLVSPDHLVSFPFTKKQPAAEPSISRSRLRHWLAPPLRHPYSRRSSKPLPKLISVLGQCIVGCSFAQPRSEGLHVRSITVDPAILVVSA